MATSLKPAAAAVTKTEHDPLEAALAAAAELAKNGGSFLLNPLAMQMPGKTQCQLRQRQPFPTLVPHSLQASLP